MTCLTRFLLLALPLLSSITAFAELNSDYQFITVPGAYCGNGSDYQIAYRKGLSDKVAFSFKGGGACWNHQTCSSKVYTKLFIKHDFVENLIGFMGTDKNLSPIYDHDHIIFPYCTGDVFAGFHEANYNGKLNVNHHGRINIEKSLSFIREIKLVNLDNADQITIYGESAGALGAIFSMDIMADLGKRGANKTLILDSPGLHWGDNLWDRFTAPYIQDLKVSADRVGLPINIGDGLVAKDVMPFCQYYSDWKMAFIQGTQDIVMSLAFGGILPLQHQLKVLGSKGIHKTLIDESDNCSSWVDVSMEHVFLEKEKNYTNKTRSGKVLKEYLFERFEANVDQPAPSYR